MRMEADLHTHTLVSDGYSTLREMVEAAGRKGLTVLGITDHGLKSPDGPRLGHFLNMAVWPRQVDHVEVLRGVEANILDSAGTLDMPEQVLERLDLVLAGFHSEAGYTGGSVEENTRGMIAAIRHPRVHIITHPGNPQFPVDLERVVMAAKFYGKALELNNRSFSLRPGSSPNCRLLARLAKKHRVLVAVNSDAHTCYEVGECTTALALAAEMGIEEQHILNSSPKTVREFLNRRREAATAHGRDELAL